MSASSSSHAAAVAAYSNLQNHSQPRLTDSPTSSRPTRIHLPIPLLNSHKSKSSSNSFTSQSSRKSFSLPVASPSSQITASAVALAAATRAHQNVENNKHESMPNLGISLGLPASLNNRNSHVSDVSLSSSVSSGQFDYFSSNPNATASNNTHTNTQTNTNNNATNTTNTTNTISNHYNDIKQTRTNLSVDSVGKKPKTDTSAINMINQVKNSINNKSITTAPPSANFRTSMDSKRNSTTDLNKKKPLKYNSNSSISSLNSSNSCDRFREKSKRKPPVETNYDLPTQNAQSNANLLQNTLNDFPISNINYLVKQDVSKNIPITEKKTQFKKPQAQKIQLRKTMRKEPKQKNNFNEDKPWKNHGDISYINEQERKRYEGVWVSNKGLYMDHVVTKLKNVDYSNVKQGPLNFSNTAAKLSVSSNDNLLESTSGGENEPESESLDINQLIHGIIVKKIWQRSRLPDDTLLQIWNLVDRRNDGTLERDEFLVGMWLVDQCLYGRKLPKVLNDAVWMSVERMGINVVIKKKGKKIKR